MKIQDVIDEVNKSQEIDKVNKVWGEKHEEKRKNIFWDNVITIPARTFIGVSLIYFAPLIVNLFILIMSPQNVKYETLWMEQLFFNSPYYIFDLRIGIIASIASLLLSLFVSVGKFADGENGINGEARRAAYRQFARIVGYMVFIVFVAVFWHGLLSGYLQGTSYAPAIFGDWSNGPGWGKMIVPLDMNLARYGDMPLWILLFFAWFTLSSSLMLTYTERDILVKYASVLRRVNSASSLQNVSSELAYRIIYKESVDANKKLSRLSTSDNNDKEDVFELDKADSNKFDSIFLRSREYIGFSVKGVTRAYFSGVEWVKVAVLWLTAVLASLFFPSGRGSVFIVLATLLLAFCLLFSISLNVRLFPEIYKFNISGLKSRKLKFFEFFKMRNMVAFSVLVVWMMLSMISIYIIEVFVAEKPELFADLHIPWESYGDFFVAIFFAFNLLFACLVVYLMNKEIRNVITNIIVEHAHKYFSDDIKEVVERNRGYKNDCAAINCVVASYVYCLVKNIGEIYSDYKNNSDSKNNSESAD